MEPLTALAVAGNIVQFVDFGIRCFCDGRKIYRSTDGTLDANKDVEAFTRHLEHDLHSLQQALWSTEAAIPLTKDDEEHRKSLATLCGDAVTVAEDLLNRLNNFKVKATYGTSSRKWQSFRQVLKGSFSKKDISSLRDRLSGFRDALETSVLFSIKTSVVGQSVRASDYFESLDQASKRIISRLDETKGLGGDMKSFQQDLSDKVADLSALLESLIDLNRNEPEESQTINALGLPVADDDDITSPLCYTDENGRIIHKVSPVQEAILQKSARISLLKSLHFPSMSNRYEDVREAYPETFDWAFQSSTARQLPWDNLGEWIESGRGIYWVSGKAGSGKSTLMKYVFDNPRTRQYLQTWGDEPLQNWADKEPQKAKLCTATFFFWNSGTAEQQSQRGLLRCLLFQIFSACPDLIPVVEPSLWARSLRNRMHAQMGPFIESWSIKKLMETFEAVLQQRQIPLKLFLLIDGLDEFDGSPEEIAELFMQITTLMDVSNVKICLSSRPWVAFEEYFHCCPKLRLQDLTQGDIDNYVHGNFRRNRKFQELARKEPEAVPRLLRDVVTKADGVFLWVQIVVKSLLNGIRNRDDMTILHNRLDSLPPELEPLYEHLLCRIEPVYMPWASQVFQTLRVCWGLARNSFEYPTGRTATSTGVVPPLTISVLLFALDDTLDAASIKLLDDEVLYQRCEDTAVHLTARCEGLLEVPDIYHFRPNPDAHVRYLHRTTRDFLEKKRCWSQLLSHTDGMDFNPYVSMLKGTVLRLGWFGALPKDVTIPSSILDGVRSSMVLAYHANYQQETHETQTAVIDEFEKLVSIKFGFTFEYWTALVLYSHTDRATTEPQLTMLEFAALYGLSGYLNQKLSRCGHEEARSVASVLLFRLVCSQARDSDASLPPLRIEVVSSLLQYGADPNKVLNVGTQNYEPPWGCILYHVWRTCTISSHRLILEYTQIMKVLAQWGANPQETIRIPYKDKPFSAMEIIATFLAPRFPQEAGELVKELERKAACVKRGAVAAVNQQDLPWPGEQKRRRGN